MIDETRKYALQVIERTVYEKAYAAVLMRRSPLQEKEMALATQLVYTVLRNLTLLDAQWQTYVRKRIRHRTRCLLDMAAAQLFLLDGIPAYAAVNSTVELADRHEKGFVNAVLHKMEARGFQKEEDTIEHAAVNTSHPAWLVALWRAHYGDETALGICHADQLPARVYGRINTLQTDVQELQKAGAVFVNDLSFTMPVNPVHHPFFEEGKYVIQDIHSARAVKLLDVKPGMKVLDACAAPGTKSQEMAMFMHDAGEITACDLYPQRVQLIDSLMAKTGVHIVKTQVHDASLFVEKWEGQFDRILLDVPCSGLGDLKHKPEIRWHVQPEDLDAIVRLQRKILDVNSRYLREEGILVYSTCTLNQKENSQMVKRFLQEHEDFALLEEKTFFPFEEDGDGFYAAKLRKRRKEIMVE